MGHTNLGSSPPFETRSTRWQFGKAAKFMRIYRKAFAVLIILNQRSWPLAVRPAVVWPPAVVPSCFLPSCFLPSSLPAVPCLLIAWLAGWLLIGCLAY